MGKVHEILEKEVSNIKKRIIDSLIGISMVKDISENEVELINLYGLGDEAIIGVDFAKQSVVTDSGGTYQFVEIEVDILLWVLYEIEEDYFNKTIV